MVEVGGAHNAQTIEYGRQRIADYERRKVALGKSPRGSPLALVAECSRLAVTMGSPANHDRGQDHMKDFIRRVIIAALGRLLADLIKRLFGGD